MPELKFLKVTCSDGRRHGRNNTAIKWPVADLLLWLLKVPDNGRNSIMVYRSKGLRVLERNLVAPDRVEIFVSKVGWFWDPFTVQQPEPAVERSRRRTRLFE